MLRSPVARRPFRRLFALLLPLLCAAVGAPHAAMGQTSAPQAVEPTTAFLPGGAGRVRFDDPFFSNATTRTLLDLDGVWTASVDGGDPIRVPVPSAYDFTGTVRYTREFTLPAQAVGQSFELIFLGVHSSVRVWINDQDIGQQVGAYTSFRLPVPGDVLNRTRGARNKITLEIKNILSPRETLPLKPGVWGWRNDGGPFRDVLLVGSPPARIESVVLRPTFSPALDRVEVEASLRVITTDLTALVRTDTSAALNDSARTFTLTAELTDARTGASVGTFPLTRVRLSNNRILTLRGRFALQNPKLWSPEEPNRYRITYRLARRGDETVDAVVQPTGFRKLERRGRQIFLNNRPMYLRGVVWREDHPQHGPALPARQIVDDLADIKALGANAVRVADHPAHPYALTVADSLGLMVLEEIPASFVPAENLARTTFAAAARRALEQTIARDQHHPSLIAYGFGDGLDSAVPDAVRPFIEQLVKAVKEGDPTRLTYYASRMPVSDRAADLTDLAALSLDDENFARFESTVRAWIARHPTQPIVLTGYGASVEMGNQNGYSDPGSAEHQAKYLMERHRLLASLQNDGLAGSFIDGYNDWLGDQPTLAGGPRDPYRHTRGIVAANRSHRLAYGMVQGLYNDDQVYDPAVGAYDAPVTYAYLLLGLLLILLALWSFGASRRLQENVDRWLTRPFNFHMDVRDQRVIPIWQTALVLLLTSMAWALTLGALGWALRDSRAFDVLLGLVLPGRVAKQVAGWFIWHPWAFALGGTLIVLCSKLLLALVIRSLAVFLARDRVRLPQLVTLVTWSDLAALGLIPLAMIMSKLGGPLSGPAAGQLAWILLLAAVGLFIFGYIRLLRGVVVIYERRGPAVYAVGGLALIALVTIIALVYDGTQNTFAYLSLLRHLRG